MYRKHLIIGLLLLSSVSFANSTTFVEYFRKQGNLAMQTGDAPAIERHYAQLLKTNPNDEDAAYFVALAQSWQPSKLDSASLSFETFVKKYPAHKDAWIAYSNLESWRKNYCKAFALLESYKARFGETKPYLIARARLLTSVGHCNKALAIVKPLLRENPNDNDLVYTNANALYKANRFKEARRELQKLKDRQPNNNDTKELENTIKKHNESLLSSGFYFYHDSQSIHNYTTPIYFDWAYDDNTHFLLQGLHEVLTAGKKSGSTTKNGHTSIYDNSIMAGVNWRAVPTISIMGMVGDLMIEKLSSKFIYLIGGHFIVAETTNIDLVHLHNLYRPYFYPTSPKAVSMGIIEDLTYIKLASQPFLQTNINLLAGYSALSDGNHYTHVDFAPTKQIALNSKIDMNVGVDLELLQFSKRLHHGYYDPSFHQNYLATTGFNYNPNSHLSCGLSVGAGIHKDHSTEGFRPASHAYASVLYNDSRWEFGVSYDYTYQGAAPNLKAYQGASLEARITTHF